MAWPDTVRKSDLRIDYYRGSGAGGQHRNKTDSACRITHLPTGLVGQSENSKHQRQNRTLAFRRLCAKLVPLMKAKDQLKSDKVTDTVRTYHQPRGTVKDHRTGNIYNFDRILNGKDLEKIHKDIILA